MVIGVSIAAGVLFIGLLFLLIRHCRNKCNSVSRNQGSEETWKVLKYSTVHEFGSLHFVIVDTIFRHVYLWIALAVAVKSIEICYALIWV